MTRQEKIVRARELREQGLTWSAVGAELGVARATVMRWLNPEKAERDRALARAWRQRNHEHTRSYDHRYDREHRGTCTGCGGPMGAGVHHDSTCQHCIAAGHDALMRRLEALWNEGKTWSEIQVAMGWSKGALSVMLHRARGQGYDLPYRYGEKRRKAAYEGRYGVAA